MVERRNYRCPYCDHHSTIGADDYSVAESDFYIPNSDGLGQVGEDYRIHDYGHLRVRSTFVVCPNPECRHRSLAVDVLRLHRRFGYAVEDQDGDTVISARLIPSSRARVLPDYVPAAVVQDYAEACQIESASPKASATLARRALQGMIRDFHKDAVSELKDKRLVKEIEAIRGELDQDVLAAIEAVRQVGNIGAHMEADISVIVEVDPHEASLLIGLIELLVDEWYVARHEREQRLRALRILADSKQEARRPKTLPESPTE
ncbi:MAG: DUF4145 domain-containing protein [Dehalococcoidia bacterium]|nr:DUF4145 domain-containing protein [Dehalococcoidia bacterium]